MNEKLAFAEVAFPNGTARLQAGSRGRMIIRPSYPLASFLLDQLGGFLLITDNRPPEVALKPEHSWRLTFENKITVSSAWGDRRGLLAS